MEPRYIASRVARNSAISTRYLAAFAAICLVSTIVLSIGALMLSTFSDDQIARAICICLDVCFLHISLAITGVIVDMLQLFDAHDPRRATTLRLYKRSHTTLLVLVF